jgi:hypothetical protein
MKATTAARVARRLHRPEVRMGSRVYGVTKLEFTRYIDGAFTLFEVIHDGATQTTTLRTYPRCAAVVGHEFTFRGLHIDTVRRLVFRAGR